jgi:hypothetical protein
MAQSSPTDFAAIALDLAMSCVASHTSPWTANPNDLTNLRSQFQSDFEREIVDLATFTFWRPRIERLFGLVATTAAFIAEVRQKDVSQPATTVSFADLVLACQIIKILICPPGDELKAEAGRKHAGSGAEGDFSMFYRICLKAPILDAAHLAEARKALAAFLA